MKGGRKEVFLSRLIGVWGSVFLGFLGDGRICFRVVFLYFLRGEEIRVFFR